MKKKILFLMFFCIIISQFFVVFRAEAGRATIQGKVVDDDGVTPVPFVKVIIKVMNYHPPEDVFYPDFPW